MAEQQTQEINIAVATGLLNMSIQTKLLLLLLLSRWWRADIGPSRQQRKLEVLA